MSEKIYQDETFRKLAKLIQFDEEGLSDRIIAKLEKVELISDNPQKEYGKSISEIILPSRYSILSTCIYCIDKAENSIIDLFGKLYIIGTGGCTICGGVLEDISNQISTGGCDGPPEYDDSWKCTNCSGEFNL